MTKKSELICNKCKDALVPSETHFSYLGHSFRAQALRCPSCGRVYLPESLVKGRMAEVEESLEDK